MFVPQCERPSFHPHKTTADM